MEKHWESELDHSSYQASSLASALAMVLIVLFWLLLGPTFATWVKPLNSGYLTANAPFLVMAIGIAVATKLLLNCSFTALVTDSPSFRFSLFFKSFCIYVASLVCFLLIDLLLHPGYYAWGPGSGKEKLAMLVPTLLITPIQTSSEEVLFRILPVRVLFKGHLAKKTKKVLGASLLTMVLFTSVHLANQEIVQADQSLYVLFFYGIFGLVVTFVSLKTGGFEFALAVHAANNLFIALICNYETSSLPSHSLLVTNRPVGTVMDVVQLLVSLLLAALLVRPFSEKMR